MRTRVKICGITRAEDAAMVAGAGADALGFVFWPQSPRVVTPAGAARIETPTFVARVGVFVNAPPPAVAEIVKLARLNAVQLHGDEPVQEYGTVGVPIIKAVHLNSDSDVERALSLPAGVTILVDAADAVKRGGTGRQANWALARVVSSRRPLLLAGGLHAGNVQDAIDAVQPWAIDVSSGVEEGPGIKSPQRTHELFAALAARERERT